ncbi:hypothetical protein [Streptobacillus moniliformis]|uniref:hypothetical protein n=2 Tax=Streptobacillus moniliformis TaxID=34105 RepID=UPI0007E3878D|nr:hypothetical protein [Streptobacillus moniliformis]
MKKLMLSLLLVIGLFSFSAKKNRNRPKVNKRYEIKTIKSDSYKEIKIEEMKVENKKELNKAVEVEKTELVSNKSKKSKFNISGPRYRIGGTISTLPIYNTKIKKIGYHAYKSISFLPEWKVEINKEVDITFGPKISANLLYVANGDNRALKTETDKNVILMSVSLGTGVDFNYKLKDNLKIYTGIETQIGIGEKINTRTGSYYSGQGGKDNEIELWTPYSSNQIFKSLKVVYIAKLSIGFKINDKYNVGFFGGYGKGNFGVEVGYTF